MKLIQIYKLITSDILSFLIVGTSCFIKGVGVGYRKKNTVRVINIPRTRKISVGVRRDDIIYMISPERRDKLVYSRPCVCGSFTHVSTRSQYCIFNPKYMDV